MVIPEASAPSLQQQQLLSVFGDFTHDFTAFSVAGYRAQGYFQYDVIALSTGFFTSGTVLTVAGNDVFLVFEMQKCPVLGVAPQDDMSTPATITTVGPSFGNKLFAAQVCRACPTLSGAGTEFYVVYKVRRGQTIVLVKALSSVNEMKAIRK